MPAAYGMGPGSTGAAYNATVPTTPSTTTMALTSGVGTGLQLIGQIYAAVQASAMGEYNAGVARANAQAQAYQLQTTALQQERLAQIAAYDLTLSAEAAAFREARLREQQARTEGQNEARIGASGVGFEGSPLAVLDENARQAEMQVLVSNYSASLEQRAIREEIRQYEYGALLARWGANERLRLGGEQATLIGYEAGSTVNANILGATGSAVTGYQRYVNASSANYQPDYYNRYQDTQRK